MSQENVEIVRDAFEGRDDILDPQFEWDFSAYAGLDVAPRGTGRESFFRLMERYRRAWLDYQRSLKEVVDAGEEVVVVVHESARLKQTQMLIERDLAQVWTFRDGKVTRLRAYGTKQEALEAVGLPTEPRSPEEVEQSQEQAAFEAELRFTDVYRRRIS